MPFIKKSFITEKLLPNVPIEKVIGQYVTLKKSGATIPAAVHFIMRRLPHLVSHQQSRCFTVLAVKSMATSLISS